MTAVLCVLGLGCGAPAAAAATKGTGKKHPKRSRCAGASSTAVDEAGRRRASRAVMCLVNRTRAAHRRRPLRRSNPLAEAAVRHSADMVGARYFSHMSASGDVRWRAIRSGYLRDRSDGFLGETLSWGTGRDATPRRLVAALMSSRPHRRTLLSRRFREVGVGLALGAPAANVGASAATLTLAFGRR